MKININNTFLLLIIVLVASCDSLRKESPNETIESEIEEELKVEPINSKFFEMADFERTATDCNSGSCSEVTVDYPRFLKTHSNQTKINALVIKTINNVISDFILDEGVEFNTTALSNSFLASYAEFKENFPETRTAWYLNIVATPTYVSETVVSVKFETSSYTGGAHPNTVVTYLNIGKEGKEEGKLSYFFKKPKVIKDLAESSFRVKEGLMENDQYSEKGFLFDNDKFELSEIFGFSESGLIIHYNPYDISAYSDGPTTLNINFEELTGNFKF